MKKTIVTLSLLLFVLTGFSQVINNPYPKTITVTGIAEMDIIPDEIYVQVDLKEYDKKGQGKINIDKIKQDFLKNVRALGIPDSLVSVAGYDGNNWNPWWRKKNKKDELYASISYLLKLKNSKQVDDLVEKLDDNATQNFFIQRTASSKMTELRKQLKIEAVRAAKEKAIYLAQAIDEKIGVAVTINEPTEYYTPFIQNYRVANKAVMMESAPVAEDNAAPVDFKKIKLKYDVTVVFSLQ
jgi:uncharacterized protein YggE